MYTPLFIIERIVVSNTTAKAAHESFLNELNNNTIAGLDKWS